MSTPPPLSSRPHKAHETPPKHKLPLNSKASHSLSSRPSSSSHPSHPPHSPSSSSHKASPSSPSRPRRSLHQEESLTPPSPPASSFPSSPSSSISPHSSSLSPSNTTTYVLSPGPSKPTLPTPWQQIEELSLIQRELTAELLSTQGKNKALVAENASLRERVAHSG